MSANSLEFHNLSLLWLGRTYFGGSVDTLVQYEQPEMELPILPYGIKCLLLPHYCEEGLARIRAQVSLKGLFWWFPGWSTGLVQQCLRLEQCWITSTELWCLWTTVSLKLTSYLCNRSHQNKLLKARHQNTLPGFSVKGEKWESLGSFMLKWKPVSKLHWFWWKQSSAQGLCHLRLHRWKSNDSFFYMGQVFFSFSQNKLKNNTWPLVSMLLFCCCWGNAARSSLVSVYIVMFPHACI